MLMRKKPQRGEKLSLKDGRQVIFLEVYGTGMAKVILPDGNISSFAKDYIDLPIINTAYYEKIREHSA